MSRSVVPDEKADHSNGDEHPKNRTFRFKDSEKPAEAPTLERDDIDSSKKRSRHRHHHHRHRRHHKRRRLSDHQPTSSTANLHPDTAFREALFDALGDDEGAEFWQGVYGQPIHTYSRNYQDADTGEIGLMDDEQYATYVRRKMWEKSAEGLEAAREARRREQREEARECRQRREDNKNSESHEPSGPEFVFDLELDASLKRGQHRKEKKRWQQIWQAYMDRWKELQNLYESHARSPADNTEQVFLRNNIAWPVETGKAEHINLDNVSTFVENISAATSKDDDHRQSMESILKAERVRWHPDKMQQRFGFMRIDQSTMETVTAVFQIIDQLWSDLRDRAS